MRTIFTGRVWKFGDNISTDLMMPGLIEKESGLSLKERAKYCMFSNRPDWSARVRPGDIIVAGKNFGCGSSRPAPTFLKELGISLVVAESMGRIFFRNAINLGLPVMVCPGVLGAFAEGDIAEVDLVSGRVKNLTAGAVLQGEPLPEDSPPMEVLRAGGIMPLLEKEYPARPRRK